MSFYRQKNEENYEEGILNVIESQMEMYHFLTEWDRKKLKDREDL